MAPRKRKLIKHLHVLIVDDDPAITELLGTFLESRGYSAQWCGSGREAMEALRTGTFDILISDIAMADVDGFELLRTTRGQFPQIGILLMTAFDERYSHSTALRAGADGYITKPFTLNRFSLIFERAYWNALSRMDELRDAESDGTVVGA